MSKINVLETAAEKEHREKIEGIVKDYIGWSREILVGQVTPNRVITHIASTYQMTREGVKGILRRRGIYKSALQPVVINRPEVKQLSMSFGDGSSAARV